MRVLQKIVSLPSVIAISLILMFSYGLIRLSLILPVQDKALLQPYLTCLHDYRMWLSPIVLGYLLIFPLLVLGLWWRQRAVNRADFSMAEGSGMVTVAEQAIRKFIRSICSNIAGITDMQVQVQRSGAGVAVRVLVKIDAPESWLPVKNELLQRIPEQAGKIIGENVIAGIEVVCLDLAGSGGGELRGSGESRPGMSVLEAPRTWQPSDAATGEFPAGWDVRDENNKPQ